ncbi:MAG: UDP-N-acetylglucosamine 2-epimerase (non-hydrolyzing), partial [Clostridiaceae bacterium]|nr:UDP-N-acetylglucosamine 2-epimerase (non-hydrolyzing) [Clostridiaceae bacterium]
GNMSDIFFEEMEIPKPDYNLNINGLGHGAMTGQMLEKIEEVLLKEKPDWVLVYGDTNSTLAGALAAKKLHIKVAHVEAGLRSFNMLMPEEINRILTDRISDILFCPTETAVKNLHTEGYKNINCKIENAGDVMQDAALFYSIRSKKPNPEIPEEFVLCTVHRAENTDNPQAFKNIFEALEEIATETPVVLPLHPRTRNKLKSQNYNFKDSSITFIEPVGYLEMVWLLQNCQIVMTDSGGLQKEACFFKKQCLTLRKETEWVELVENGFNTICGSDKEKIISSFNKVQNQQRNNFGKELYGDGKAGIEIVNLLQNY